MRFFGRFGRLLVGSLFSLGFWFPLSAVTEAQEFEGLGDLPGGGFYSIGTGISGDGTVAVGVSESGSVVEAFRWSSATGMVGLGDLGGGGFGSTAYGANADGSVIVGISGVAGGYEAFLWTAGTGMVGLGHLAGGGAYSAAYGVNADGSVVVGDSDNATGREAIRWTLATGMVGLGYLPGGGIYSSATGVNADGSVVVGSSDSTDGRQAFRWTQATGMVGLGELAGGGYFSVANGVSSDGLVVVGVSEVAGGQEAFRWTQAGGMVGLGDFAGGNLSSRALGVSGDGSVVVGTGDSTEGPTAFRWTAATGMQSIKALLVAGGVDMSGWFLREATGVSQDGTTMVGVGANPSLEIEAWIARLTPDGVGITTPGALQNSSNSLADAHTGLMAQQHGFAVPLLGDATPMNDDSEVGVFGTGGSAAGGGFVRYATGSGLALLAGVSYGEEAYQDAAVEDSLMGALALRYLDPSEAAVRPFGEVGGWYAPNADMEFERSYMNGAGTAVGVGKTEGDVSYIFARAGVVMDLGKREQVVVSGEVGRERLELDGYTERVSAANPFYAAVAPGTDEMDIAKLRLAWSFGLGPRMDATVWGGGSYGFNRDTDVVVGVVGVGGFAAEVDEETAWAEYGARVGYALTDRLTLDVMFNGVSGEEDIGTRVHGGGGLRYRF